MATVGHAYLKILPSLQDLGRHLRQEVAEAERAAPPVHLDVQLHQERVRRVSRQLASFIGALAADSVINLSTTAATGAALGLASALAQAAGSAAVLPGVLAGIGIAAATAKLGLSGVSDALKALADGDPAKVAEAMGKLAPAARQFVTEVHALTPAFSGLKLDVQQALFAGLSTQVRQLGAVYFPMLRAELPGIATALNQGTVEFGRFAASGQSVADLRTIITNTRLALTEAAPAGAALAQVFRDIAVVGSEFLVGFGAGIKDMAQRLADFIARARESGQLQTFLSQALSTLGDLLTVLGNLGGALFGLLKAGQETGAGLLSTLVDLTGQLKTFVNSVEGQQALKQFFTAASQLASALLPLLLELAKLLATVVAPAIAEMGMALLQGGGLKALLDGVAGAVRGLAPALGPIGQAISAILVAVSPLLPVLGELAGKILIALSEALVTLTPMLTPLVDALIQVFLAALPLIDPLAKILEIGLSLASALLPGFIFQLELAAAAIRFVADAASLVVGAVGWLKDRFADAASLIDRAASGVRTALSEMAAWAGRKVDDLINFFVGLPGRIWNLFTGAADWLVHVGHNLVVGLWNGLVGKWNEFVNWVSNAVRGLINEVKSWFGISSPSKVFAGIGRDLGRGLTAGIEASEPMARRAAQRMAAGVAASAQIPAPVIPEPRSAVASSPATVPATGVGTVAGAAGGGWDPATMQAAITLGVLAALDGARLSVDGAGVAQLVNTHNARNARR